MNLYYLHSNEAYLEEELFAKLNKVKVNACRHIKLSSGIFLVYHRHVSSLSVSTTAAGASASPSEEDSHREDQGPLLNAYPHAEGIPMSVIKNTCKRPFDKKCEHTA